MINIFKLLKLCISGDEEDADDKEKSTEQAIEKSTEQAIEQAIEKAVEQAQKISDDLLKLFDASNSIKLLKLNNEPHLRISPSFHSHQLYKKKTLTNDKFINSYYKKLYPRTYTLIAPSFRSQDPNDFLASLP